MRLPRLDNYQNPVPGMTYISPGLTPFGPVDAGSTERVRIATKAIDTQEEYAYATVKAEKVVRITPGGRTKIVARFLELDRKVLVLTIQRFSAATNKPQDMHFSFVGDEISTFCDFLTNVQSVVFKSNQGMDIPDDKLKDLVLSQSDAIKLVGRHQELFTEILKSEITKSDAVALGYRKRKLEVFRRLLDDREFFDETKTRKGIKKDEALWQAFFEANSWIFGYGLNYIYLDNLDGKKLEQVVQGYEVNSFGKRADGLMKTRGALSSLCFVEIKTHETDLLAGSYYRKGCWPPSTELVAAVSQAQGTVFAALDGLRDSAVMKDDDGNPTGEEVFNFSPKSFLVAGSLGEFKGEHGVNEDKLRSFELYRRNCHSPEIITFDELYERARYIVNSGSA